MDSRPTGNMLAYDLYLRGLSFFSGSTSEADSRLALQMFEKAVGLDPEFALAWAMDSRVHSRLYNSYFDRSPERLRLAGETSERALSLAPDLPEALIARGLYFYWGFHDFGQALAQFDKILSTRPDHAGALELKAYILRRHGRFEEALSLLNKVLPLNPRAGILAKEMGTTAGLLRRYPEAHRLLESALSAAPSMAETYCILAQLILTETGDRKRALATLDAALEVGIQDGDVVALSALLLAQEGRSKEAMDRFDRSNLKAFSGLDNYEPRSLVRARLLQLVGRKREARREYERAVVDLRVLIRQDPADPRFESALGLALAGLGSRDAALAAGRRAVELMPIAKDALEGPPRAVDLARIHALLGQSREAADVLKPLLSYPCWVSLPLLQSDPIWQGVSEHIEESSKEK